jgi:hypothetical protein
MISVIKTTGNNGKEYTNIAAIMQVPPQVKKGGLPEGHNKTGIFSIDEPDMGMFDTFSEGLRSKIESSPEWQARAGERYAKEQNDTANSMSSGFDDMKDDIPF